MRKFVYKKLIRDKILDHMLAQGERPEHHALSDQDFILELKKKILEEGSEILTNDSDKLLGELADLQEVIDYMLAAIGKNSKDLKTAQDNKRLRFGSFEKRVFVDSVMIPEDNQWISYLESNPDRYPEIKDSSN